MDINATLLGQAITFAILILFTMKFVWPPLNKMLEERAKQISDGLQAAEKGKQELLLAESKVADELKKVNQRSNELLNNAEKRATQIIDEAKNKAIIESQKIVEDAKNQIEQDYLKLKEHLRLQVSSLVIKGAEQILRSEIDSSKHEILLGKIKAEL